MSRVFTYTCRVRYNEVDRQGVIYHPIFLRYFENARIELLREIGFPHRELEESGTWFVVTEAEAKYVSNVGYDAEITVETQVSRLGRATVDFSFAVRGEGRVLTTGRVGLACTDGKGRVTRMPEALRRAFEVCEGIAGK